MDPAQRHSAGATVVHQHPFKSLDVPEIRSPWPQGVTSKWVAPLYMKLLSANAAQRETFDIIIKLLPDATEDLVTSLLSYFHWRSRIVGAYVAAFADQRSQTGLIGRLLLRSDVCYAGRGYCVALAHFNTPEAVGYLREYLNYYLTRNDLWYDQLHAMSAIAYLDIQNGTDDLPSMMGKWEEFMAGKPMRDLKKSISAFGDLMATITALSAGRVGAAR